MNCACPFRRVWVLICTRQPLASLNTLLSDLADIFSNNHLNKLPVHALILDDSRSDSTAPTISSKAFNDGFRSITILNRALQNQLIQSELARIPSARRFLRSLANRNSETWDLGRAKQVITLYALRCAGLSEDDAVLFIDDDMRLKDTTYAGRQFRSAGTDVIEQFLDEIPRSKISASGCYYVGRADCAFRDHFVAALRRLERKPNVPFRLDSDGKLAISAWIIDEPRIPGPMDAPFSGAMLCTNPISLAKVPTMRIYNEDWIWIETIARNRGLLRTVPKSIIHAGAETIRFDPTLLQIQAEGDIAYRLYSLKRFTNDSTQRFAQVRQFISNMASELASALAEFRNSEGFENLSPDLVSRIDLGAQELKDFYIKVGLSQLSLHSNDFQVERTAESLQRNWQRLTL